jgi:hypothetical protein
MPFPYPTFGWSPRARAWIGMRVQTRRRCGSGSIAPARAPICFWPTAAGLVTRLDADELDTLIHGV